MTSLPSVSYTDITMSPIRANVVGSLFAVPLFLVPCGVYVFIWGSANVSLPPVSILVVLTAFLAGIVAHELLHGVGFLLGGASRDQVDFGIHWYVLSPYAHCRAPLRADTYRLALILPALALGLLPAMVGLALEAPWIVFFGAVMLAVAGGDAAILWALRHVPRKAWVQDHPSDIGCLLLDDGTAETPPEPVTSIRDTGSEDDEQTGVLFLLVLCLALFVLSAGGTYLVLLLLGS